MRDILLKIIVLYTILLIGFVILFDFILPPPSPSNSGDGLGGAAFFLLNLVLLAILVFVYSVLMISRLAKSFFSDNPALKENVHVRHLIFPALLIIVINAIAIQGYVGFSGFVNMINGVILLCLSLIFIFSSRNKIERMIFVSWFSVFVLILYAFVGYTFLYW